MICTVPGSQGSKTVRKNYVWRMFYPTTTNGMVRTMGSKVRFALFGIALYSLYKKEEFLAPTEGPMFDRIERRGAPKPSPSALAAVCVGAPQPPLTQIERACIARCGTEHTGGNALGMWCGSEPAATKRQWLVSTVLGREVLMHSMAHGIMLMYAVKGGCSKWWGSQLSLDRSATMGRPISVVHPMMHTG